eukprot:2819305-Rhodomonas_salina.2
MHLRPEDEQNQYKLVFGAKSKHVEAIIAEMEAKDRVHVVEGLCRRVLRSCPGCGGTASVHAEVVVELGSTLSPCPEMVVLFCFCGKCVTLCRDGALFGGASARGVMPKRATASGSGVCAAVYGSN